MENQRRHRRKQSQLMGTMRALVLIMILLVIMIAVLSSCEENGEGTETTTTGESTAASSKGTTGPDAATKPEESTTTGTTAPSDTTPPEITGVEDILAYMGDTVSYRSGVTTTDDSDSAPTLSIDSSAVDLSSPGTYQVVYTAADAAGNTASVTATVTVMEKKAEYADLETIYNLADEKLANIVSDGMTAEEQVKAIYKWARSSFGYSGHSDKDDWLQGAYIMLTEGQGDCFNYFAVCKLMFERLGIENIDVRKVKNYDGDSDHFWSLVSVDGGENYYHFDATPRVGSGDDFCLVTDAFLDAYSAAHKNCHNRDKSLYPATPEE